MDPIEDIEPIEPARPSALLRRTFWIPGLCLVAVELSVRRYDGWGAWATAPLFLVPSILALAVTLAGVRDLWALSRAGRPIGPTLVLTLIAAAPIAWLLVRRHVV